MPVLPIYLLLLSLPDCRQPNSGNAVAPAPASRRAATPFPVGAALNPTLLTTNAPYRQTAVRVYSGLTSENHLKMHLVHPAADRPAVRHHDLERRRRRQWDSQFL